jgi:putative aminopeptidase
MTMQDRIKRWTEALMMIPGLSGFEGNVRRYIKAELKALGLLEDRHARQSHRHHRGRRQPALRDADRPHGPAGPHRAQDRGLGPDPGGAVGGVPERALAAHEVLLCVGAGPTLPGVIANKSHHATTPEEKYRVLPYQELYIDCGFGSAADVLKAGVNVGTPIVYAPRVVELAGGRLAGTSVDDRAACAIMLELARSHQGPAQPPDRASRLLGAGGVQPARRADGGTGAGARHLHPARPGACHRHARHGPPGRRAAGRRGR